MNKHFALAAAALVLGVTGHSTPATADGYEKVFEVAVTNLTRGQTFTPILVASHRPNANLLFTLGDPASPELASLAEGGATVPLENALLATPDVRDTNTSAGVLGPGETVSIEIEVTRPWDRISLAAMLIPTNDAFFSAQNVPLPGGHHRTFSLTVPAYDAGSEPNDELCVSIPGPPAVCGGEGGSPGVDGEGFVHVHAGIHGIGDLAAETYDWRNPVALITVRRLP